MDWLRAGAARRMGELAPDGAGTHDPTDIRAQRDLYGVDTQQELLGALATLPPRQRAVIVLRYWKTCPKPRWLRFLAARPAAFAPGLRSARARPARPTRMVSSTMAITPRAAFQSHLFYPAWSDNSDSTGTNPDGKLHQLDLYSASVCLP